MNSEGCVGQSGSGAGERGFLDSEGLHLIIFDITKGVKRSQYHVELENWLRVTHHPHRLMSQNSRVLL